MPDIVDMDECIFLPIHSGKEELMTFGVSTCICLMVYGHLENHLSFIGMYHWSGFHDADKERESTKKKCLNLLMAEIADTARTQLGLNKDVTLYLDKLYTVGGEKRALEPNGELLLSGTEQEVIALEKYIAPICQKYFTTSENTTHYSAHYLTKDQQDLTVIMDAIEPAWKLHSPEATRDDEFQSNHGPHGSG